VNLVLASSSPRRRELLTQAGFSFEVHPAHIPEDPYPNEDPKAYVTRLAREKAQAVFNQLIQDPTPSIQELTLCQDTQDPTRSTEGSALCQGTTSVVPQTRQKEAGALAPEGIPSESQNPGAPAISRSLRNGWETTNLDSQPLVVLGADTTVTLDNHILGKPENPADAARMLRLLSGRTHRVITGVAVVTAAHTQVASESTAVQFLALADEEIASYIATGEPMDKAGAYAIQGRAARWIPRIEGDYFNVMGLPIALVYSLLTSCLPVGSFPRE
jgi:septum formation protein